MSKELQRQVEYHRFVQKCHREKREPPTFRDFCETMNEFDLEWEVAKYEYEQAVKDSEQ